MSTRATYTFKGETEVHTYIHYDGYPEGAATYFRSMLAAFNKDVRGGAAEQFIRGNHLAEITSHWDDHGDTEYHYSIEEFYNKDTFSVEYVVCAFKFNGFSDERTKSEFFHGTVTEFIKKYGG
ncbi:hypothetical protein EBZ39_07300 [bacterium]|nr:hypothetical protein [bacterium]